MRAHNIWYKCCGTISHIKVDVRSLVTTMKLQRQVAYKYKDKPHYKHVIIIPNETVEELGWKVGEELKNSVEGKTLILKPKNKG